MTYSAPMPHSVPGTCQKMSENVEQTNEYFIVVPLTSTSSFKKHSQNTQLGFYYTDIFSGPLRHHAF